MALWHITTRAAWAAAQAHGEYRDASLEREGFIHLSTERQWRKTANRFYRGQRDLLRLRIDETQLDAPLRFEPADADWFPHLYGPLPLAAVQEALALHPSADGSFEADVPPTHAAFLARVVDHVRRDPRVDGLLLGGSSVPGLLDEHSDLDLVVCATAEHREQLFAEREALLGAWGTLLAAFTGEHVGEPRLVIALYDQPLLHVDVKLVTEAELAGHALLVVFARDERVAPALARSGAAAGDEWQWVEDRFWVWVHYGASKIARGELFEALDHLGFVRVRALGALAALTRGQPPRGVRFVERDHPRLARALASTVARLERADLCRALRAAVEIYRALRAEAPSDLRIRTAAEQAAVAYLETITHDG